MSKMITLDNTVQYSKKRIKSEDVTLENFISTDNILQNKLGITQANNLPPNDLAMPSYSEGDILIANIRPYLKKIWFADKDGGCSSDVLVFETKKGYFPKFIYYNLFKDDFFDFVMKGSKGTKMPRGDKNQILDFLIPDFELPTQKKIAKVLSDLDAKIELNNKINAELEAMAKTLYDYWFVQFDFLNEEGKPYKLSGGKMVWNEVLKREIPQGWKVIELEKIAKCIMGQSPKGESYNLDKIGIPLLNGPADYENGVLKGRTYTTEPTRLCQKDDLVLCIRATIGNLVYSEQEFCLGRGVAAVRPIDKKLSELIYFLLLQEIERFKIHATGSIIVGITKDDLIKSNCLIPNEKVLDAFHKLIKPQFDKIRTNLKQNQELVSLRDWLLPMLMNGQVTVASTNSTEEIYKVEDTILGMVAEPGIRNLSLQEKKLRRKMLATFIVNQSLSDTRFGKTKFEKLLHLIEYHIVKDDFNQKYSVQTAGPYDGGFTKLYWDEVLKAKWFKIEELGSLKRIVPGENHSKSLVEYNYFSAELKESISQFISLFKSKNYEKAEIVSTLFAVWNNRIINNEMITDALLKKDFLGWDKQKVKYADYLDTALAWMKKENIIPDGWGKYINRAKGK